MSWTVTVVPMSAPSTTAIAWGRVMRLEAAKPTSMTVTAVDDWMMVVTTAPETRPTTRFFDRAKRMVRNFSPATICRPSRARLRPWRKMARPPRRTVRSRNDMDHSEKSASTNSCGENARRSGTFSPTPT